MEMGKSATKATVMFLSGKFFYQKKSSTGVGDLKCCGVENLLAPPGFLLAPPDQKSWLRLCLSVETF
jgi:hypothetical protein